MEHLLIGYIVFVVTTTILTLWQIYIPVVNSVFNTDPKPHIAEIGSKTTILLVLTIITMIVSPAMFFIWLSPYATTKFITVLEAELKNS